MEQKRSGNDTPFTSSCVIISIGCFLLKVTVIKHVFTALCMNRPSVLSESNSSPLWYFHSALQAKEVCKAATNSPLLFDKKDPCL